MLSDSHSVIIEALQGSCSLTHLHCSCCASTASSRVDRWSCGQNIHTPEVDLHYYQAAERQSLHAWCMAIGSSHCGLFKQHTPPGPTCTSDR
jgi:hypothetical protein